MTENVIWQPNKVSAKDRYRVLGQKGLVVNLHVLHARSAGGTANPDILLVGLHGVGDIGVDLVGSACHMHRWAL